MTVATSTLKATNKIHLAVAYMDDSESGTERKIAYIPYWLCLRFGVPEALQICTGIEQERCMGLASGGEFTREGKPIND